jgi:ferritin-like metal-binding protein YciE
MKIQTLTDLMIDHARDMLDAEKQLVKALPRMARAASSPRLRKAFEIHLEETRNHAQRLMDALEMLGHAARAKKCRAMQGLLDEGKEILELDAAPDVKDAALIAAAQKVEHYEIAGYGCLCTWAELLGESRVRKLLGDTLREEETTDDLLTEIAANVVNPAAVAD